MDLKNRVETTRGRYEELHLKWLSSGGLSISEKEEYEWLKTDIQLIQAEALTRLAYKSW